MIPQVKNENELRKLAGLPIKEAGESLDNILAKHRESFESVMMGQSMLYDHDTFFDELYEYFVNSGEMPYGIAKAREGDPDQWIQEYLEQEYGDDFATDDVDQMDGDFDSGMASAGMGTDEENDKAMMMKLTTKAMKAIPNSPKQKELIKQVNTYREKLGMKPMNEKYGEGINEHHEKDADGNPIPHKEPETFKEHLDAVQKKRLDELTPSIYTRAGGKMVDKEVEKDPDDPTATSDWTKKHRGEKLKDYGRKKQRQAYERYWRKGFKAGVRADTMLKHGFVSDTEK